MLVNTEVFFLSQDAEKSLLDHLRQGDPRQRLLKICRAGISMLSSAALLSASVSTLYNILDIMLFVFGARKPTALLIVQLASVVLANMSGIFFEAVNQFFPSVRRVLKKPYIVLNKLIQLLLFNLGVSVAVGLFMADRLSYPFQLISNEVHKTILITLAILITLLVTPFVFALRYPDEAITKFQYEKLIITTKIPTLSKSAVNRVKSALLSVTHRLITSYFRASAAASALLFAGAAMAVSYDVYLIYALQPILLIMHLLGSVGSMIGVVQAFISIA